MSLPFYVNPETATREKADFARRNIARGRPIVALEVTEGVLIVSENPSRHLRKIADRLNLDSREYRADDPSRAADCPDSTPRAGGRGGGTTGALDRGPHA